MSETMRRRLSVMEQRIQGASRCKSRRVFIIAPETATPGELEAHRTAVAQAEQAGHDVQVIRIVGVA